jgi:hypothetical protein
MATGHLVGMELAACRSPRRVREDFVLSGRTAQLLVNGGTATTLTFRHTYSWNDYWTPATTVGLTAGTNTLKFSHSSSWAPGSSTGVIYSVR